MGSQARALRVLRTTRETSWSGGSNVQFLVHSFGGPIWWFLATLPLWVSSGQVGELFGEFWWQVWPFPIGWRWFQRLWILSVFVLVSLVFPSFLAVLYCFLGGSSLQVDQTYLGVFLLCCCFLFGLQFCAIFLGGFTLWVD